MAGLSKFFVKLAMDNAGFLKAVNEAGKGVDNFKKKGKNVGNMFAGFGGGGGLKGLTMFTGKIAGIAKLMQLANQTIKEGVRTNVAFEKSLSMLAGISGTSVRNIKELENEARRLGATTAYTAAEVVALETELAKLGFSRKEILNSTEAVLKFSLATGSGLSEAAALAGSALRSFGADSSEMGRYVSAMAISTTKSALSFDFLQNAMSTVAPVAKSYGFAIEDVLALLGTLADAGFDASAAATATRNIFLYLADASGKLSKQLGEPVRTLPELVAGLKKLKDSGVDLGEALELTDKRSVAVFSTFLDNTDKILGLQKALTGVEGELDKMAATMADNVDGALKGLSSAWEGLTLAFSKGNGVLKKTIDFLTDIVRIITPEHMSRIEKLMQGTGVEWRKEEEKEEEKSNQTDADVAKKYADNLKAEVERKIKSGSTRDAAIADVVTPARDNQKKYLDDARQKLKELAQQGDDLEKVIAKRRKEFNRVAPVNQHEYAEGTYERLAQLEKLAAKIEETKKLIAAYEAQEKALNAAFTDQPEEQKKEIKIPES
jgi:TP901 family phage tail tape measure protein